jgi:hypothetical protein
MKSLFLLLTIIITADYSFVYSLDTNAVFVSEVKFDGVPDYKQRDKDYGGFEDGGRHFCGPTSASDLLTWLSKKGYTNLAVQSGDLKFNQYNMIKEIAGPDFMKVTSKGVCPDRFCRGVSNYITAKGYNISSLKFEGFRKVNPGYFDGYFPRIDSIKNALDNGACVWLEVGWYNYIHDSMLYKRSKTGHWLPVIGYQLYNDGSFFIIVHDSDVASGPADRHVSLSLIEGGTLLSDTKLSGLPRQAAGYYKLGDEMHIDKKFDAAILDGILILRMK